MAIPFSVTNSTDYGGSEELPIPRIINPLCYLKFIGQLLISSLTRAQKIQ